MTDFMKNAVAEMKILALLTCSCLILGQLIGCSGKTVDYGVNTEGNGGEMIGSLEQFADAQLWEDEWTLSREDGTQFKMKVNAKVTVPDTDAMSVVEAEETVADEAWIRQLIEEFFGDSPVYYYDYEHYTKDDWYDRIEDCENVIQAVSSPDYNAQQPVDDIIEEYNQTIEYYEGFLADAPDDYVVAEDFGSCDQFLGYIGDIPCEVDLEMQDEEKGTLASVVIEPQQSTVFGPDTGGYTGGMQWTDSYSPAENTCEMSEEEARQRADTFLNRIGITNQVCYDARGAVWYRLEIDEGNLLMDSEELVYGYTFTYGTGVDGVAFSQFGGESNYDIDYEKVTEATYDWGAAAVITVTDEGIVRVSIQYPVTINTVSDQVNLLPLETIQNIMKDEVVNNTAAYDGLESHDKFDSLDLIYFRIRDDEHEGCYSYVPAWRLSASEDHYYYHPVLVNAIDGSVIHILDEL